MNDDTLYWMTRVALADGYFSHEEIAVFRQYATEHNLNPDDVVNSIRLRSRNLVPSVIPVTHYAVKGYEFENAVAVAIAEDTSAVVESRAADFKRGDARIADERSFLPDLLIRQRVGAFTLRYWVECKFRSSLSDLRLTEAQIRRYSEEQRGELLPVFILAGIGGSPSSPSETFLIRSDEIINGFCGFKSGKSYTFERSELSVRKILLKNLTVEIKKFLI